MKHYVGYKANLGSDEKARNSKFMGASKSVGHKGQEGSDPNFPDDADHIGTCVKIENETVYMKCACGLEWTFPDDIESTIERPKLLGDKNFQTIKHIPTRDFRIKKNPEYPKIYNYDIDEIKKRNI